jgi:hypothetical protein
MEGDFTQNPLQREDECNRDVTTISLLRCKLPGKWKVTVDDAGGVPPPHLLAPLVAKALGDGRDLTEIGLMRGLRKC